MKSGILKIYFENFLYCFYCGLMTLIVFMRNSIDLVLVYELASASYVLLLFFNTVEQSRLWPLAFLHFIAASLMSIVLLSSNDVGNNHIILLISLLIYAGVFPFSFWLSYCHEKVFNKHILYLQTVSTKLPFLIMLDVFSEVKEKVIFLFLGILTASYAIIFVGKILPISIANILIYFFIGVTFSTFHNVGYSVYLIILSLATLMHFITLICFYRKEEPNKIFAYNNIVCAGINLIAAAYLRLEDVVILFSISALMGMLMLHVAGKSYYTNKYQSLELSIINSLHMNFRKNIRLYKLILHKKFFKDVLKFYKKSSLYNLKKLVDVIQNCYLQTNVVECNILLSLCFIVISVLLFYVF